MRPTTEPHEPALPPYQERTCRKIDFVDTTDGQVLIRSPRTHELAEMVPRWTHARPDRRTLSPYLRPTDGGDRLWLLSLVGWRGHPTYRPVVTRVTTGRT